jgi:hypothetical protein
MPLVFPYSAENTEVEILYSCSASGGRGVMGPVASVLLFSTPSKRNREAEGRCPFTDSPRLRVVVVSEVTPGCVMSRV